ncbi:hypothetical protein AWRI1631_130350 [Saccharomyces cerevisiae AWRI1631]|uniref:Uncharacterized protein n=1 Tax=Saccharomyces cerevisiae (strain AWRI1631) TaxID=545124 RepID=B5VP31_YEAS6|nr:hypothetical protein AWRI1631_130350 [Saccharomyces cerevisiae AWRI1631]
MVLAPEKGRWWRPRAPVWHPVRFARVLAWRPCVSRCKQTSTPSSV